MRAAEEEEREEDEREEEKEKTGWGWDGMKVRQDERNKEDEWMRRKVAKKTSMKRKIEGERKGKNSTRR